MKRPLILSSLVLPWVLMCCPARYEPADTTNWKLVNAGGKFTFKMPTDCKEVDVSPIDSFIGEYRNNILRIRFDYGSWSDPLDLSGEQGWSEEWKLLDGRRAKVVTFRDPKRGGPKGYYAAVHFPDVNGKGTRLTMTVNSKDDSQYPTAFAILESIVFIP